jgi:glycosyltransferase involved in cell wall biosynthesis
MGPNPSLSPTDWPDQTLSGFLRVRKDHPELDGRPVVVFLGRLHHKKGLPLLLDAFARGAPGNAVLVVVGPDEDGSRPRLERQASHLGIADRLIFTGMISGSMKFAALADSDLFVLPSQQENFGNAVVESLAVGTPVLISDRVGVKDALGDLASVAPLTVDAFATGIASALERKLTDQYRRELSCAVLNLFNWESIASRWQHHYKRLSGGK